MAYSKDERNKYQQKYREDGREPGRKGNDTKRDPNLDRSKPDPKLSKTDPGRYSKEYMRWWRSKKD
jgi:hypothetical protein